MKSDGIFILNSHIRSTQRYCDKSCPAKFCNKDHFHEDGYHLGHGACKDLIFVLNEQLKI